MRFFIHRCCCCFLSMQPERNSHSFFFLLVLFSILACRRCMCMMVIWYAFYYIDTFHLNFTWHLECIRWIASSLIKTKNNKKKVLNINSNKQHLLYTVHHDTQTTKWSRFSSILSVDRSEMKQKPNIFCSTTFFFFHFGVCYGL